MELYEIILEPLGGIGTPLKGDTIFGHFCWQAFYDDTLLEGGLDAQVRNYFERPFVVFSSVFPKICIDGRAYYALKRPDTPLDMLFSMEGERLERLRTQKKLKAKKWMVVEDLLKIDCYNARFLTDLELAQEVSGSSADTEARWVPNVISRPYMTTYSQPHNTINRMTQTTKSGMFAPFSTENLSYMPGIRLVLFVLIDPGATDIQRVRRGLERIGIWGYGRDASTGMGRFSVVDISPFAFPKMTDANACYTLAPSVPEKATYQKVYFSPFVRFGKHGDRLACSRNPFKNPAVMADEGAVLIPNLRSRFEIPYVGTALKGLSKASPGTLGQGYAPYLPIKVEI